MKVLKFGGTSVGTADSISEVGKIIAAYHKKKERIAVVFSAFGGVTNTLSELGELAAASDEQYTGKLKKLEAHHFAMIDTLIGAKHQSKANASVKMLINELEDLLHGVFLLKELSPRTFDLILSFGERLSCTIMTQYLHALGVPCSYLDARSLVRTDDRFGRARVNFRITNRDIKEHFKQNKDVAVITGFIGSTDRNETTTLGRGGSDYTASIFAAALDAKEIEIWTDVDGVMTADPREVKKAFSLPAISYIEAMELSHFGAKVIYSPTVQPAFSKKIPIRIRNTFNPEFKGTLITDKTDKRSLPVKGISSIKSVSLITLLGSGMVGVPGVSARLFGTLANADINVILITQASSEISISFAVDPSDTARAKKLLEEEFSQELKNKKVDRIIVEEDLSILAIIGENMRNTPGISGHLFSGLGKNGINIVAIAQGSSELNLSIVIDSENLNKALNVVHEAFFLSDTRTLNLFIVGTGLIGGTLLKQIDKQAEYLLKQKRLKINIVGLCNSKKMLLDENGISLKTWKKRLDGSKEKMRIEDFVGRMQQMNLPNSIFVDNTSSAAVIEHYNTILSESISIVTPNKLANSGPYKRYRENKLTAFRTGALFLYETNVGAGLPVINTLEDLKNSGDQILKIEGVLSGSLSYIFNTFKKGVSFSDVVLKARESGFTEPDPRDDLNGMDVARKILILARETGHELELKNIKVENILPKPCQEAKTIDQFFAALKKADGYFDELREKAEKQGKLLRFIAKMEKGKATVSLQAVDSSHPFYSLSGSDNMIAFTTQRYLERPLVIKGPGAGAEVTAAGVFANIISISNYLL